MLIDSSEGTAGTYYFQLDDLNTVHALLDHNGTAVERYDYSAYGETRIQDSNGQTLMVDDDADEEFDLDHDGIIDIGYPRAGEPVTPRVVASQSQFDNPFGYAGMRRDEHSGLYHTHYREYNPNLGRWLTPDPAGYQDGQNLYCYYPNVNGVDVLGLALYAFDGTGTDYETWTNVSMLHRAYMGRAEYEEGVGSRWYSQHAGGVTGLGGRIRLLNMYQKLVENFKAGDTSIDIVGFSRGASLAREFANMINEKGIVDIEYKPTGRTSYWSGREQMEAKEHVIAKSPEIRFVGLFDTVGSFGVPGNSVNLGIRMDIPPNVKTVAHAISRDERRTSFPMTRLNKPLPSQKFVEKSFDGDHSDIGSGHMEDTNFLSLAPLDFILMQALKAGVPIGKLPNRPWPYMNNRIPHDLTTELIYFDGGKRKNLP
jgi:RHS repeat-associated protein